MNPVGNLSVELQKRLAQLAADAVSVGETVELAADAAIVSGVVPAIIGAGAALALPNEWFGEPNNIADLDEHAISEASRPFKQEQAARSIGVSGSLKANPLPIVQAAPPAPTIEPVKNQVTSPPNQIHAAANPFVYPKAQVSHPPRRLAAPAASTPIVNPTPTAIQQVQQGSVGRVYGNLLHSPQGNHTHINYEYDTSAFNQTFAVDQKTAATNFSEWIKGNNQPSLLDTGLIFIDVPNLGNKATNSKGDRGTTATPLFGSGISHFMGQYGARSKAANRMPTHGLLPATAVTALIPLSIANPLNPIASGSAKGAAQALSKIKPANLLSKMPQQFEKIKAALLNSWVLEFLTFCAAMHNAAMLSTNIVQSCAQIVDNILEIFGVSDIIKDDSGNKIDVMSKLGINFEYLIKYAIGKTQYDTIKEKWKLYNAIYTAGANIVNTIGAMQQATMSVLEVTGSYCGRIGNALKAYGVIGVSFDWMSEAITARSARYDKLNRALDETQQFSGDMAIVSDSVLSAKQGKDELVKQKDEFIKALDDAKITKKKEALHRDAASTPPPIKPEDER